MIRSYTSAGISPFSGRRIGQDSLVTIFDVNLDGLIGAYTFIHRKGNLQTFYVQIGWREGGVPEASPSMDTTRFLCSLEKSLTV